MIPLDPYFTSAAPAKEKLARRVSNQSPTPEFTLGQSDAKLGCTEADNPFPPTGPDHAQWLNGYQAFKRFSKLRTGQS